MSNRYPLLDRKQIEKVLKKLGFNPKKSRGSHVQWEGYIKKKRRIVTVDTFRSQKEKYSKQLLQSMIRQSGLSKNEFYAEL